MFENDLNHNFLPFGRLKSADKYFACSKCKIIIFKMHNSNVIISNMSSVLHDEPDNYLNYTCDEVIIKSLLE